MDRVGGTVEMVIGEVWCSRRNAGQVILGGLGFKWNLVLLER